MTQVVKMGKLNQLLGAIMYPASSPVTLRYQPEGSETAVRRYTSTINLNWTTLTSMRAFIFKETFLAIVHNFDNLGLTWRYDIVSGPSSYVHIINYNIDSVWLDGADAQWVSGTKVNGTAFLPRRFAGVNGFWCDQVAVANKSSTLQIILQNSVAIAGGRVTWYRWNTVQWEATSTDLFVNGTTTYTMLNTAKVSGYYAAKVTTFAGWTTNSCNYRSISAGGVLATEGWAQLMGGTNSEVYDSIYYTPTYRVLATSISLQITGATVTAADLIQAVEITPQQDWPPIAIDGIQSGYKGEIVPASSGYTGYIRPCSTKELQWSDTLAHVQTSSFSYAATLPQFPTSKYIAIEATIADSASRLATLTVTQDIEYLTTEATIPTGVSQYTTAEWTFALWVLSYANPHSLLTTNVNTLIGRALVQFSRYNGNPISY
jgi:hypothetical protein